MTGLRPRQAAVLGVLEQPWTLTALAAVTLVSQKRDPLTVIAAFLLFSVLSTATVIAMFAYYAVRPDQARDRLGELKVRLVHIGPIATAVLSVVIGAFLLADGIFGLLTN